MKKLLLTAALLVAAAGVAFAQDVRYNFDKQANFAAFKTYKWVVLAGGKRLDDLVDKQVREAVDAQLATKGLVKSAGEQADMFVTYQAAVDKEKSFSAYSSGMDWGYGPGWGYGGWYGGGMASSWTTGQTETIYVGQLVVDMYDSANRSLVWRGTVSKTLSPKAKPDKQQRNLNKALAKLFENYPPRLKD